MGDFDFEFANFEHLICCGNQINVTCKTNSKRNIKASHLHHYFELLKYDSTNQYKEEKLNQFCLRLMIYYNELL